MYDVTEQVENAKTELWGFSLPRSFSPRYKRELCAVVPVPAFWLFRSLSIQNLAWNQLWMFLR